MDINNKDTSIDFLDDFYDRLEDYATYCKIYDFNDYIEFRSELYSSNIPKDIIPKFIKENRRADDFRSYIQQFGGYAERRKIIKEGINTLIEYIEERYSETDVTRVHFQNLPEIGTGGFGTVYKDHNSYINLDFAIKILTPHFSKDEDMLEWEKRFFREAKMLYKINNKHVVKIYDVGKVDNKPYIKMEFIDGYNLYKYIEIKGIVSFSDSTKIIYQIVDGLACAHQKGIIHRDIKPSNIMYCVETNTFKLIDFGIGAYIDNEDYSKLTKTGEVIANGNYCDPLLKANPALKDKRCDIYSIGCIWYFLLCGRSPSGSDMKEFLLKTNQTISDNEAEIVMKCLCIDINNRYCSCNDLLFLLTSKYPNSSIFFEKATEDIIRESIENNFNIFKYSYNSSEYNNEVNSVLSTMDYVSYYLCGKYQNNTNIFNNVMIGDEYYYLIEVRKENTQHPMDIIMYYCYFSEYPSQDVIDSIINSAKRKKDTYINTISRKCDVWFVISSMNDDLLKMFEFQNPFNSMGQYLCNILYPEKIYGIFG